MKFEAKHAAFLFMVLLLIALGLYLQKQPNSDKAVEQLWEPTSKPTPTAVKGTKLDQPVVAHTPLKPPTIAAVTKLPPSQGQHYSKQGLVHFKVEHGMAIAFGDILLGKLVSAQKIDQGFFKPPRPQLWRAPAIAYAISPDLPNPERVEQALEYLSQVTPLTFVKLKDEADAVVFEPGFNHCYSYVGRIGGHQPISLSESCSWLDVVHEVMHALGFVHEHSRTDRDQFVQINWDNIEQAYRPQFDMVPEQLMTIQKDTPFDYSSLMIYPPSAFAIDPTQPTLRSIGDTPVKPLSDGLSAEDIAKISRLLGG